MDLYWNFVNFLHVSSPNMYLYKGKFDLCDKILNLLQSLKNVKTDMFVFISRFETLVQRAMSEWIMRQINQSYFERFTLIGFKGINDLRAKAP